MSTFAYTLNNKINAPSEIFSIILWWFFLGQNCIAIIYCWVEERLKTQNHFNVTSPYVQTALFITLGWVQQSMTFPAFLIRNRDVIEKLEQSWTESQKIDTVIWGCSATPFFFRIIWPGLVYPTPTSWDARKTLLKQWVYWLSV